MVMQAYVDDSYWDHGKRRYFLCGYVNSEERWKHFSRQWNDILCESPAIRWFHAVEAQRLSGEFAGWSQASRTRKVLRLAKLIEDSQHWGFSVSFNRAAMDGGYSDVAPRVLRHPFQLALWGVIFSVAGLHEELGMDAPVSFIFDEQQGQDALTRASLDWMAAENPRVRKVVDGTLMFGNDKDFVPLQAADMLAWHMRRSAEGIDPPNSRTAFNLLRASGRFVEMDVPDEAISDISEQMKSIPFLDIIDTKAGATRFRKELAALHASGYRPLSQPTLLKRLGLRPDGTPKLLTLLKWKLRGRPEWAQKLSRKGKI